MSSANVFEKKIILSEIKDFCDFSVEYQLYEYKREVNQEELPEAFRVKDGFRKSFDIKLIKKSHDSDAKIEESVAIDFEWRMENAIKIFKFVFDGEVTPMCLEDVISDLI